MLYELDDREKIVIDCYRKGCYITKKQLEVLHLLKQMYNVRISLNRFCYSPHLLSFLGSPQTVRNVVNKFSKLGLIGKVGKKNKKVYYKKSSNE